MNNKLRIELCQAQVKFEVNFRLLSLPFGYLTNRSTDKKDQFESAKSRSKDQQLNRWKLQDALSVGEVKQVFESELKQPLTRMRLHFCKVIEIDIWNCRGKSFEKALRKLWKIIKKPTRKLWENVEKLYWNCDETVRKH